MYLLKIVKNIFLNSLKFSKTIYIFAQSLYSVSFYTFVIP